MLTAMLSYVSATKVFQRASYVCVQIFAIQRSDAREENRAVDTWIKKNVTVRLSFGNFDEDMLDGKSQARAKQLKTARDAEDDHASSMFALGANP